MCSPTRAGLMTGRYPIRYGCGRSVIPPQRDYGVPTDEVMLPAALGKCGYENRGAFGKWHLGHLRKRWLPLSRGFTEFYGCYNGAIDYFTHQRDGELDWHHNWDSSYDQGYSTDLIAAKAAAFIRRSADQPSPFFCYVAFNAPHAPFQAPKKYESMYSQVQDRPLRAYYAMITAMDDGIGKVLDALDEKKIADNTLVWFFSDNGGVGQFRTNNLPLKGAKLTTYEGGVRTVAAVRYPAAYRTKAKITAPTVYIDIVPTVLSLAGMPPAQAGCKALDGIDLNPILSGRTQTVPERDLYFYYGQDGPAKEMVSVVSGAWKLTATGPDISRGITDENHIFLYDIRQDPNETQDIAADHREVAQNLTKKLIDFRNLQPPNAIAPFNVKVEGFVPPREWKIETP
jgi:arylsulfatase B